MSLDAGARLRTAQITTLFDGKTLNADDANIWSNAGTGTGSWGTNKFDMSVTSGQYYVRQSRHRFPYFSGKSQIIELTFDNFDTEANTVKRAGYFSSVASAPYATSLDGFFLEDDGTTKRLRAYRSGTSTLNVAQASWDAQVKGTYNFNSHDWSKFNVVLFDFLWLGGAVLRMFVDTPNGFVLAHTYIHAAASDDVFMLSPNQPVRYEIVSTTGTGNFRAICSAVGTEGSIDESGQGLTVLNSTSVATNSIGTEYVLLGIKKQTTYRDNAIQMVSMSLANTATSDSGILVLTINPTLSASLTYGNNSRIQTAVGTGQTVTSGGRRICAMPIGTGGGDTDLLRRDFLAWLASTIADAHDEYILSYIPTTSNQSVNGVLNIKEY